MTEKEFLDWEKEDEDVEHAGCIKLSWIEKEYTSDRRAGVNCSEGVGCHYGCE